MAGKITRGEKAVAVGVPTVAALVALGPALAAPPTMNEEEGDARRRGGEDTPGETHPLTLYNLLLFINTVEKTL